MKPSKVVVGVLAGAAVGALLGVLFAPHKGAKTRRKIAQKSQQLTKGVKEQIHHVVDSVSGTLHTVKKEANGMAETTRSRAAETIK